MEGTCLCSPPTEAEPTERLPPSAGNSPLLVSSSASLRGCPSCRDRACSRTASNYARRRFRSCPSFPHAEGGHLPAIPHSTLTPLGAMHALLCPPPCLAGVLSWLLQSYLSFITALFEGSVEATAGASSAASRAAPSVVGPFLAASAPAASAAVAAAAVAGSRAAGPAPRGRLASVATSSSASPQGPSSASLRSSRSRPSSSSCPALATDMVSVATSPALGAASPRPLPPLLPARHTSAQSSAGTSAGSSGSAGGSYGTSVGSSTFGSFRSELTSAASSCSSGSCSSSPEKERPGGSAGAEAPMEAIAAGASSGEGSSSSSGAGPKGAGLLHATRGSVQGLRGLGAAGACSCDHKAACSSLCMATDARGSRVGEAQKQAGIGERGAAQGPGSVGVSPPCRRDLGLGHSSSPNLGGAAYAWQPDRPGTPRGQQPDAKEGGREAARTPLLLPEASGSGRTGAVSGVHGGPSQGPWHWWTAPWGPGADRRDAAEAGSGVQDTWGTGREQHRLSRGAPSDVPDVPAPSGIPTPSGIPALLKLSGGAPTAIPALVASTTGGTDAEEKRKASQALLPSVSAGAAARSGALAPVPTWATEMAIWEEEECCPTCLEEYTSSNPQIDTECGHSFHLSCIYEWMERSPLCPVCMRTMAFKETL